MGINKLESVSGGGANETAVKYKIDMEKCMDCYLCVDVCPAGAIDSPANKY